MRDYSVESRFNQPVRRHFFFFVRAGPSEAGPVGQLITTDDESAIQATHKLHLIVDCESMAAEFDEPQQTQTTPLRGGGVGDLQAK